MHNHPRSPQLLIKLSSASVLLIFMLLTGCANLEEVRQFASQSAQFSAYTELTDRYRDTYQREHPYLISSGSQAEALARQNDAERQAIYPDLIRIHTTVSLYMQILAVLAGDDTFDLSEPVAVTVNSIKAHPSVGIEERHVEAFAKIADITANRVSLVRQKRAIKQIVQEAAAPLQTLFEGMLLLVDIYQLTNHNEERMVLGFYELQLALPRSRDPVLTLLVHDKYQIEKDKYEQIRDQYEEAKKGIESIAEGHKQLLNNADNFSRKEFIAVIRQLSKDIRNVRKNLQDL